MQKQSNKTMYYTTNYMVECFNFEAPESPPYSGGSYFLVLEKVSVSEFKVMEISHNRYGEIAVNIRLANYGELETPITEKEFETNCNMAIERSKQTFVPQVQPEQLTFWQKISTAVKELFAAKMSA